ncbi:MAG: BACON domain-containing carbohydrate-binding protein [Syntrophobacteraceae bacterium]
MNKTKIRWDKSLFALLLSLFFLAFFSSSVLASPEELATVLQRIQSSGARWQAAETSISQLPEAERVQRLGLVKGFSSLPAGAAAPAATPATGAPATPPATLGYNVPASGNTYGYVTPIRDQGNCGSCWAFSTTAALESQYLMSTNGAGWTTLYPNGLAVQILLSCSTAGNCSEGGYIDQASQYIQSTGLPPYSCYPYTELNYTSGPDTPCANAACSFWQSQTYSIKGWEYVSPQTAPTAAAATTLAAALESYLNTYGPLVTTMNVYTDFFYYSGGIYSYTGPGTKNGYQNVYEGGHAIEIIGYNHASQYFIVKNSWGTGWGTTAPGTVTTPGFFYIAYSQLVQMTQAQTSDNIGGPEFGWYSIAYTGYGQDPCTYSLSSSSASATYSGGNASVGVISPTGCAWPAVSNVSWISIVSGAKGTGDGTVTYSVAANNTTTQRVGTLTIAGQTFTVTQAAASCSNASISPTSASPGYSGGNATANLTSPAGCPWTAASNASWIIIVSGGSGSGNGTVTYSVAANPTGASRIGTLTIAGKTLTVTQAGAPCTYSLSSTSANPSYTGGSATVNVTSLTGCAWTAVSTASWISVVSGASGSGNGTVTYSVAANTAGASRTGTLTIAGKTFTVTQGAAPCSYSLSATSASPTYTGGSATVGVISISGCSWTAVSNASWISVVSGASGSGSGTVTYSVAANTAGASRVGTLTIAGKTFTITQGAAPCTYSLSATSASPAYTGGSATVNVTSLTGCAWTAVSNASWISVVSGASGSGSGTVTYSVTANNAGASRVGTLTIAGKTFTVTQGAAPCTYSLSATSASPTYTGGSATVGVTSISGCSWTAVSNVSWISVVSGASGSGNGTVTYSVAVNNATTSRTGTITIAGKTFTVTQAGK